MIYFLPALYFFCILMLDVFNRVSIGLTGQVLMLHIAVITPLLARLCVLPDRSDNQDHFARVLQWLHPVLGFAALSGFLFQPGSLIAVLSGIAWFTYTILLGVHALNRLRQRLVLPLEELSIDAGLLYSIVGGFWFLLDRAGQTVMGFDSHTVTLTAIHFHYAGFAMPVMAGHLARRLHQQGNRLHASVFGVFLLFVIAGPALTGLGIAFSQPLEWFGVCLVIAGVLAYALSLLRVVLQKNTGPSRYLLLVSALASLVTMYLAAAYAFGFVAGPRAMILMLFYHGAGNALVFVLPSVAAWFFLAVPSRLNAAGIYFSRLYARRPLALSFFEDNSLVEPGKTVKGLVDNFDDYASTELDVSKVPAEIKDFYENTVDYELEVYPHWSPGFRLAGRLYKVFSGWFQQMNLPVNNSANEIEMTSEIKALSDHADGRKGVRAWARAFRSTGRLLYAAAYANHHYNEVTYMNIAFPVYYSNVTSILRLANYHFSGEAGLSLTSRAIPTYGDQGVYLARGSVLLRMPINETIFVFSKNKKTLSFLNDNEDRVKAGLIARHDMFLLGIKFLSLDYHIYKKK